MKRRALVTIEGDTIFERWHKAPPRSRYGLTGIAMNQILTSQARLNNGTTAISVANMAGYFEIAGYSFLMSRIGGAPSISEIPQHMLVVLVIGLGAAGIAIRRERQLR